MLQSAHERAEPPRPFTFSSSTKATPTGWWRSSCCATWRASGSDRSKEDGALTPVIPLVIYHGERPWRSPTGFLALMEAPAALRPYLPDFRYHPGDFSHLSDETIRGKIWLRVSLSVLRAIFNPDLRQELGKLIDLIFQLSTQRTGVEYIRTILYYFALQQLSAHSQIYSLGQCSMCSFIHKSDSSKEFGMVQKPNPTNSVRYYDRTSN